MTTHVLMVTDMSGSMSPLASDVRGGFNSFLDDQAKQEGQFKYTVVLFDHEYMPMCKNVNLEDVPRLTESNYMPRGNTALLDAVGRAVSAFDFTSLGEDDKVVLVIQTDGYENASREWNYRTLKSMLDERRATGKLREIYIGAGVDSWNQAQSMGMHANSYLNTSGSKSATRSTYGAMAQTINASTAYGADDDFMEEMRKATENK